MNDVVRAVPKENNEEWPDQVLTPLITQHPNWSTSFTDTQPTVQYNEKPSNDNKKAMRKTKLIKESLTTLMSGILRRNRRNQHVRNRTLRISPEQPLPLIDPATNRPFISNNITTTRYTLIDFLPKQLYAQFSKVANLYFLFVAILQMVPGWSPTGQFTTILPLAIFTCIAMAREGYDDLRRKRADQTENNATAQVLRVHRSAEHTTAVWQDVAWKDVHVGDLVQIQQNDWIPADCFLLYSPNEEACGYVETAALDGESNLKKRHAVVTDGRYSTPEALARLTATISTELPNADLNNFHGHIEIDHETAYPLTMENLFLRGTVLRNTPFVYGMVVFTGEESKIRMNLSRNVPTKAPSLQQRVNRVVIAIFVFVIVLASVCAALAFRWEARNKAATWYLSHHTDQARVVFQFIILFNTMIPISLYVTMEMIKLVQAWLISNDVDMYYEETDTPATAHTSTINEELGQVNFVFSDKTGTLTENLMVFRKISCGGWAYLHDLDLIEKQSREGTAIQEIAQQVHRSATRISRNSLSQSIRRSMHNIVEQPSPQDEMDETMLLSELNSAPRLKVDNEIPKTTDLMQSIAKNPQAPLQRRLQFFLLAVALCHTVIPQVDPETGDINYQAASPDEFALVNAAKEMGYVVIERSVRHIMLKKPRSDEPIRFDILNVLDFSSRRKRMSVIIRLPDNRIVLFCKGADSIVLERSHIPDELVPPISPTEFKRGPWHASTAAATSTAEIYDECDFTDISVEEEQWEYARTIHHIQEFATEGLRTLLYAHRFMTQTEYDEWNIEYTKASLSIEDRQENLFDAAERIEVGLRITGATAIEDKLQEGVPDTIDRIRKAGMRMWMLTGDKRETAINIGYSCSLIHNNSRLIYLEAGPQLENVMLQALKDVQNGQAADAVLIMDGITLGTIENDKEILSLFCQLGCLCQSVICCRFSPAQKALVVKATRAAAPRAVTLAIGDGANDCAMIQEAHVGIGITGKEGMQAARASDYSMGQFRFLCKLLLVHGHWSYIRVAKFTLGTFFKCMTFYLTQGIFQLWTGFSGTSLYEGWSLSFYNTLFSSLPVMMIGVFERDFRASTLIANPELYKLGQRSGAFNFVIFLKWIVSAWWYAACIVLIPLALNGTLFVFAEHHGQPSPNAANIASLALFDGSFQLYSFGLMLYAMTVILVTLKVAYLECHTQTIISHLVAWAEIGCFALYNLIYSYAYPASKSYEYAVNGEFVKLLRTPMFWLIVVCTVTVAIGPSVVGKAVSDWVWPSEEVHFQELEKDERISQLWEAETKRQIVGVEKKTIVNNNSSSVPSYRPSRRQKLQFKRSY